MIGLSVSTQRFSLYNLDEGEMFIKDFVANVNYYIESLNERHELKGIIYIGSRSVIFEPDDNKYSLVKFNFKEMLTIPYIIPNKDDSKTSLNFEIKRIIEIPKGDFTEPYILHHIPQGNNLNTVSISFLFEKSSNVSKIINELIDKYNNKQSSFEFDSLSYLREFYSNKFDLTLIKSFSEKNQLESELFTKQILPLLEIPGLLMITDQRIYFQPLFKLNNKRCVKIKFSKVTEIYKRKVHLLDIGIELITRKKNVFLVFENELKREQIFQIIIQFINKDQCETNINISKFTKLWVEGGLSNYDYLIKLNNAANRTRNDLSQYLIFPWILKNYKSLTLDLNDSSNYRDLSLPVGALNQKRLEDFLKRYKEMPGEEKNKFIYGTHYSTSAYVIGFLSRKFPQYMLKLHSGKFDHPDRLFTSIELDWEICLNNPGSLKELIPEFYEDNIEFLVNSKKINMGINTKGEKIDDIILPPWSDKNPEKFLKTMKSALESNYVNEHINEWIDLIFGYKQRGEEAIKSNNLFHPSTYEDGADFFNKNEDEIRIIQLQTREFGICPKQLFLGPHPKKFSKSINEIYLNPKDIENIKIEEFKNSSEKKNGENTINFNLDKIDFQCLNHHHKQKVSSISVLSEVQLLATGCQDGNLKLYDLKTNRTKRISKISDLSLNSITNLNSNNSIAIGGADNKVYIVNTILCRATSKFEAHDDSIVNIFYSKNLKKLITDGMDSNYKLWDISEKTPIKVYYDTESQIISCDFRTEDDFHICLDNDKYLVIRKIDTINTDCYKIVLDDKTTSFVKFNKYNLNEYVVGSKTKFNVYDFRTNKIIESYENFGRVNLFESDSTHNLISNKQSLFLTKSSNCEIIKEWNELGEISSLYMEGYKEKESNDNVSIVIIGNEKGDVYYSTMKF